MPKYLNKPNPQDQTLSIKLIYQFLPKHTKKKLPKSLQKHLQYQI